MALFGLFGKKKKKEELQPGMPAMPEIGLGKEHELGLPGMEEAFSMPGAETPPIGAPPGMPAPGAPAVRHAPPAAPAAAVSAGPLISSKDIEVLSAKLDALKAVLDSINQRLIALERIASEGREHERYY